MLEYTLRGFTAGAAPLAPQPQLNHTGGDHGGSASPLRRPRHPQGQCHGLRSHRRRRARGAPRRDVCHHDRRPGAFVGVAEEPRRHARRDGGHRRVLEAGLGCAVRGDGARARPGQRGPRQGRAGPQDGRERRDLARRSPRAWPDPPELRAARRRAGVARPHPHPQAVHPRAERPRPAHRQAAAGGQPQARVGPLRHHGSGRAVLDALASGESDPERLADQVCTKVRASRAALVEALRGRLGAHQRVVLRLHLAQADAIEAAVAELDREVGDRLAPFCDDVARLSTMPGLSSVSASAILSEIGSDMSRFPTAAHLVSWAGLCPRNDESAGRRRSTRLRHGATWLKTLLVQAAWSAVRVKASYHSALFYRLRARRGAKKAIVAVAASMLTAIHVMLARGVAFRALGADHFERTNKEPLAARLMRTLKQLGYTVALTPMNPTGPVPY